MRASESHRVRFHGAPVLAVLGEPGELGREPWFSRDAIRTAAAWAGMADAAADGALADLAARGEPDDLRALGAGRIVAARATIDRWLEHAAARADAEPEADLRSLSRAAARGDRRRRPHDPRRGRARLRLAPVRHRHARSTARAATSSCSCSSTGSTRWSPGSAGRRCDEAAADRRATSSELYASDPDPWGFETSAYEQAKYAATIDALEGRRFSERARGRLLDRRAHRAPRRALRRAARRRRRAGRGRRAPASGSPACRNVTVERRELPEDFPAGPVRADRLLRGPLLPRPARVRRDARRDRARARRAACSPSTGARPPSTYPLRRRRGPRAPGGALRPARRTRDRTPDYALDRFDVA